jgi:plastocyanin
VGTSRTDARTRSSRRARRASIPFAGLLAVGVAVALLSPAAAPAAPGAGCDSGTPVPGQPTKTTYKCNIPTGTVGGYEVRQWFDIAPTPPQSGYITHMETDIIDDVTGEPVPISRLMLHHIVFVNVNRPDNTCRGFRGFDSRDNYLGGASAQRFYAAGEERAKFSMPPGYGYQTDQNNTWGVVAMVMNHRSSVDHALIHYEVTIDSSPLTAVEPYWLDVRDCRADPIYNVPGVAKKAKKNKKGPKAAEAAKKKQKKGKKKRKKKVAAPTTNETRDYVFPESGRLIGGGGHVHGGAVGLRLTEPNCGNREVARSDPTWGNPDHPFYNVRPILHEPGPINMSAFGSTTGLPVRAGETIRLNSIYDNSLPHVRVMGIMVVYLAPDPSVNEECGPVPNWDILRTNQPGRPGPVPFKIPLTGLDSSGQAISINAPPGPIQKAGRNTVIPVGDRFFGAPNLRVKQGSWLTWQFNGSELHNVTLANGPLGIGTDNLDGGRTFTQKLNRPGTYRLFCALHPVQMQERVIVTPKKKKHKKKR